MKKKYRIGVLGIIVFVCLAGIFDLLTLIPFVGTLFGWVYFVIFTIYLVKTGHGFINAKTLAPQAISIVAEFIPAVQELPTIIAATIAVIAISRIEDKTGISLMPGSKIGVTAARKKINPANKNGVRGPMKRPSGPDMDAILE
ncbi:MAG: hypothetical protein QG640_50 [Patescibacteria group bacterium]|nr:hypothetical protein [Patescibacteria group bacterium]